jgi:hypothetical protein
MLKYTQSPGGAVGRCKTKKMKWFERFLLAQTAVFLKHSVCRNPRLDPPVIIGLNSECGVWIWLCQTVCQAKQTRP